MNAKELMEASDYMHRHVDDKWGQREYDLRCAAETGNLREVKELVRQGADVCAWNCSALRRAQENAHHTVAAYLVQKVYAPHRLKKIMPTGEEMDVTMSEIEEHYAAGGRVLPWN